MVVGGECAIFDSRLGTEEFVRLPCNVKVWKAIVIRVNSGSVMSFVECSQFVCGSISCEGGVSVGTVGSNVGVNSISTS